MQGLPIQNLVKMPKVSGQNASKNGVLVNSEANEDSLASGLANLNPEGVKNLNIDFETLLSAEEGKSKINPETLLNNKGMEKNQKLNSKSGEVEQLLNASTEENKIASKNIFNVKSEDTELTSKIAGSTSGIEQLLNNLKETKLQGEENTIHQNNGERNFFIKENLNNSNPNTIKSENESPLEYLIKTSKENKVSENEVATKLKEPFFIKNNSAELIPNDLKMNNDVVVDKKLGLVSGEDFLGAKKTIPEQGKNKELNLNDVINKDFKGQAKVINYQNGQNVLNDNVIRSNKDLAFKDVKKTKHDAIEELKSPEMKKPSELSAIKDAPILAINNQKDQQNLGNNLKSNEAPKILDLKNIDSTNANQIIEKISDYVMQSRVAGKDQIDLTVKHESLGQFQIQVNKMPNQNQIDMQIVTSNHEGHKFFVENENALMKSLQQSGIQLSDLRIVSSMSESNTNSFGESRQFSSFSQNQNGQSEQHSSFQGFSSGEFRQGKERRNELWNEYRERYGA